MKIFYNLVLTLDVILNFVELSSSTPPKTRDLLANFGTSSEHANHQELSADFERLHHADTIACAPRSDTDCSPHRHSPERILPLTGPHSPVRLHPPAEPPRRPRSRSPSGESRSLLIFGYVPELLRFLRLIPKTNPNQVFQIQRYTFPADKPIQLKVGTQSYRPIPTDEQSVLSTSSGDVVAILERDNRYLRGIFTVRFDYEIRVKMNVYTGDVVDMTSEESAESPIGHRNPIKKKFKIVDLSEDPPEQ